MPWYKVMRILGDMFSTGSVPSQLCWETMVLIPKEGGAMRGIGLLEILWKVVSSIINHRLTNHITFHHSLHGFRAARGTGSAIMEAKFQISLSELEGTVLYQAFLDLTNAYDTLDRGRMLEILVAYGFGPNVLKVLASFWEMQKVAVKQRGYYGRVFQGQKGSHRVTLYPQLYSTSLWMQ